MTGPGFPPWHSLVGGCIPTPLKNMTSSIGMMRFPIYGMLVFPIYSQYMGWLFPKILVNSDVPNHQPVLVHQSFANQIGAPTSLGGVWPSHHPFSIGFSSFLYTKCFWGTPGNLETSRFFQVGKSTFTSGKLYKSCEFINLFHCVFVAFTWFHTSVQVQMRISINGGTPT